MDADSPALIRSITLSVPALDRARRFWVDALGLTPADITLHRPEHETLWGLEGAERESLLLWAGDVLVELVSYTTPECRWRPAGYLVSDQGILNVALGCDDRRAFDTVFNRALELGYSANSAPWTLPGIATVVYLNDDQGFSVELLHVEAEGREYMGFTANRSSRADRRRE